MDYTGTIAYNVSRSLADVLAPLEGKTIHNTKNSKELVDEFKNFKLEDDETLVSFDVVSLFTNTPVDKTLEVVQRRLQEDTTLKKRTNLDVPDIME